MAISTRARNNLNAIYALKENGSLNVMREFSGLGRIKKRFLLLYGTFRICNDCRRVRDN